MLLLELLQDTCLQSYCSQSYLRRLVVVILEPAVVLASAGLVDGLFLSSVIMSCCCMTNYHGNVNIETERQQCSQGSDGKDIAQRNREM
jgi:hypothetical protein